VGERRCRVHKSVRMGSTDGDQDHQHSSQQTRFEGFTLARQ